MKKQSVLLGLREKVEGTFGRMLDDFLSKFGNKQSTFMGFRKTYQALEGYADDDTKRGFQNVSGTVKEQLDWFKEYTADYFRTVLSIEKTNATGTGAMLIVDGKEWGHYSVLELLRLKTVLDGKMRKMVQEIPIRDEKHIWTKHTQPEFGDRAVWETPLVRGFSKTTLKDTVIIEDAMIEKSPHPRAPMTKELSRLVNVGEHTSQDYSGAITARERALIMAKYDMLYNAIIEAMAKANDVDSEVSDLGDQVLAYLF